ncbi:MAG: NADPH-dependent oxidoreductase [Alphaproteobacteria bacterium]
MSAQAEAKQTAVPLTSETIEVLLNRRSIRKFTDRPVPDAQVEAILRAAFRAPTSSNIQSYTVIVVKDRATRETLSAIASNQKHVVTAPVFLAFCADLTRIGHALAQNGKSLEDNNLEAGLVASIDAALVGMSAYLAADSLGLQGVMIGAVRNNAAATAKALGLPPHVYCVFGMCLGHAAEMPPQKPRMPYEGMVHLDRYDPAKALSAVEPYDAELMAHYVNSGRAATAETWSRDAAAKFGSKPRDRLRQELKDQGFDWR